MSKKLWIEHTTAEDTFVDKVPIEGCEFIDDLLDIIKERPQPQLLIPTGSLRTLLNQMASLKSMLATHLPSTCRETVKKASGPQTRSALV
jgi:hypothetical protein